MIHHKCTEVLFESRSNCFHWHSSTSQRTITIFHGYTAGTLESRRSRISHELEPLWKRRHFRVTGIVPNFNLLIRARNFEPVLPSRFAMAHKEKALLKERPERRPSLILRCALLHLCIHFIYSVRN